MRCAFCNEYIPEGLGLKKCLSCGKNIENSNESKLSKLEGDIKYQADWIAKAMTSDKLLLDYTINSLIKIDIFFELHSINGKAKPGGRLSENLGIIIFSIGSYIGETIIRNVPGTVWETDDNSPEGELTASIKLPNGITAWPMMKAMKRFQNGFEDSIYPYACELVKGLINVEYDKSFWEIVPNINKEKEN